MAAFPWRLRVDRSTRTFCSRSLPTSKSTGRPRLKRCVEQASIGLSEYAQRFADNAIDLSVIRDLTEQDLKDLGVLLGHRRKILRAITQLPAPAPTETATERVALDEFEHRHLTVMICDLVGSTALSARVDPEDMRVVIDAYHGACARITRTYDGFLAQFRGDGIVAYFGYPFAHEDDAERSVR